MFHGAPHPNQLGAYTLHSYFVLATNTAFEVPVNVPLLSMLQEVTVRVKIIVCCLSASPVLRTFARRPSQAS